MSFTLMRYKDGIPAPIKMSIWDAFKSSPLPKPAKPKPVSADQIVVIHEPIPTDDGAACVETIVPVECSCCHKIHSTGKSEDKVDAVDQDTNDQSDKNDKNKKTNENGGEKSKSNSSGKSETKEEKAAQSSTHDTETYSKKDDKIIIEMKQGGKSWKEIMAAIGKESKSQLQAHWKTIDPDNTENAAGKDEQKSDKSDKKDDTEAKKGGGQGKDQKQDSNKKTGGAPNSSNKNEKTEQGELKSWSDRYDKQKWIAAASRHFDLTGQRVTPAMAKKIAESK